MPTHKETAQFLREWSKLTPHQQTLFLAAVQEMIEDLRAKKGFRRHLRVKRVQRVPGVFEMTWTDDGRATFSYGDEILPGDAHIIWRRIGTHDVLLNP